MTDGANAVVAVRMPQANVNDEEVTLVNWHVSQSASAIEGEALCEVETSKSVGDVPSPASGIVRQLAKVGDVVAVGEVFAYIGPSVEAIERFLSDGGDIISENGIDSSRASDKRSAGGAGEVEATAGAVELARRHGLNLADISAAGKVRRSDVEAFIAVQTPAGGRVDPEQAVGGLPSALADKVTDQGMLSAHQSSVVSHLQRTQSEMVVAHVVMDVCMKAATTWMEIKRQGGVMVGPLPVLIHGAAVAIASEPKLASFRLGRQVYRYRSVDVAFTARSGDGRLFTPVVKGADVLSPDELAAECGRLSMAAFRGQLEASEMSAGCLTVSILNDQPVRFHIGLQNAYQSVLLTAGAIRDECLAAGGQPTVSPVMTLSLSYDHGLMDGWEAAAALQTVKQAIEQIAA